MKDTKGSKPIKNTSCPVDVIQSALRFVDSRLIDHGERVAFLLKTYLESKGWAKERVEKMCLLAAFHDIGAFETEEVDKMVCFET